MVQKSKQGGKDGLMMGFKTGTDRCFGEKKERKENALKKKERMRRKRPGVQPSRTRLIFSHSPSQWKLASLDRLSFSSPSSFVSPLLPKTR